MYIWSYSISNFQFSGYDHFKGKRAILSFTTGGNLTLYEPTGIHGDMRIITWPIENGCLNFVGYSVLKAHICYSVVSAKDEQRKEVSEKEGGILKIRRAYHICYVYVRQ